MPYLAHGFVDGAYLRSEASEANLSLTDPRRLVDQIISKPEIQSWAADPMTVRNIALARVIYYDARPDDDKEISPDLKAYWEAVELLNDTEVGFGSTRGGIKKRPPRQKGVDTLIAVDMLVGAFTSLFSVAVLVAGDADFVPVVNEVKRRGVMVTVAAVEKSVSADLKRAADRFFPINPSSLPVLRVEGKEWRV